MNLERQAVKQVYDRVQQQTHAVRDGHIDVKLLEFFRQQGIEVQSSIFPTVAACDDGVYTGTVVSQDRRVFEFYYNCDDLADFDFDDVTEELGPKDPDHPSADCMEVITMSLMYYDHNNKLLSA